MQPLRTLITVYLLAAAITGPAAEPPSTPRVLTDRFGDSLPSGAVLRLGTTAFTVPDVAGVGIRAGGTLVAVDRALNFFACPPGQTMFRKAFTIPHRFPPDHASVSADGRFVAVGTDTTITLWDVSGERPVELLSRTTENQTYRVFLSPDGTWLAANVNSTREGKLLLAHRPTKTWRELPLPETDLKIASFSLDGKRLAVICRQVLLVFDTSGGQEIMRVGQGMQSMTVALSPSGNTLLVLPQAFIGARPAPAQFLSVPGGEPVAGLTPPVGVGRWAAFAPDGKTVLFGGSDGVRVWDPVKGIDVRMLSGPADAASVFSPDGRRLVSHSQNAVLAWDVATGQPVHPDLANAGHRDAVSGVTFSPDGRRIATNSSDGGIIVWATDTGRLLWRVRSSWSNGQRVVFSPDSQCVIAIADDYLTPVLYDAATGKVVRRFDVSAGEVSEGMCRSLRLSSDGRRFTANVEPLSRGTAYLVRWDVATGKQIEHAELNLTRDPPRQFSNSAYSPDGRWSAQEGRLAPSGTGNSIELVPEAEAGSSLPARFSVDSRLVAHSVSARDNRPYDPARDSVAIYDIATRARFRLPTGQALRLAFSPNDRVLAVYGRDEIGIWEWATGRKLGRFAVRHQMWIRPEGMEFSPDGRLMVTGSEDCTALVWGLTDLLRPTADAPAVTDLAASCAALTGEDESTAYRAEWALVERSEESVPLLRDRLRPPALPPADTVAVLVRRLDAPKFADRTAAERDLRQLGESALPGLHAALKGERSAEARRRIEDIISATEATPPTVGVAMQVVRGVRVLEQINTASARTLLKDLAAGAAGLRLTREATAALDRIGERPARKVR